MEELYFVLLQYTSKLQACRYTLGALYMNMHGT